MKTVKMTIAFAFVLSLGCISLAQTNWMDWRYGRPGVQVVTNAPSRAEHAALSNTVAGISSVPIGVVTDLIANAVAPLASTGTVAALSSSVDATNAMFSAWFSGLHSRMSYWDTAYSWGDWHAAVASNSALIANAVAPLASTGTVAALSSSVDATNAMFSAWFAGLQSRTSYWDTAYSWGDWHAAVANNSAAIAVLQTNTVPPLPYTIITNAPWLSDFSTMTPADIITAGGVTNAGTDHAALSNLTWPASGHSGTPARLAGFFEGGMAGYSYLGAGLYFGGSDELSVSNDIITGAALGKTALQSEADLAALRLYHYGSPDIIESPAEWFTFDGAGTITGVNSESVTNWNIVIPWEIGGVPVTEIGVNAFMESGVTSIVGAGDVVTVGDSAFGGCFLLVSVSLPQVQTVGNSAFAGCASLTSVSLPQVQTVGNSAFAGCASLTSVSLPQVQTVGPYAFGDCHSLTSVSLPQVQTVGPYAFDGCWALTSFYFDNDAPTIGDDIFSNITTNQVTNYVMSATATGWGATLGGMPVVRLPLHTDSLTLGGVTHTNWPSADVSGLATTQSVAAVAGAIDAAQIDINNHTSNGTIGSDAHLQTGDRALIDSVPGLATTQDVAAVAQAIAAIPDSIVRGLSVSSTNILVSSTNSVYYVALDNAANIGFDFSALSLGGTKRADITAVIDCLNTQALYSAINTNLVAMDCPWEPTVTGRYELAVSSDGIRTNVRQASPSSCAWRRTPWSSHKNATGVPPNGPYPAQINWSAAEDGGIFCVADTGELRFIRTWLSQNSVATGITVQVDSYYKWRPSEKNTSNVFLPNNILIKRTYAMHASMDYSSPPYGWDTSAVLYVTCHNTIVYSWTPEMRDANALERAAYNAGAYPAAFRLDY